MHTYAILENHVNQVLQCWSVPDLTRSLTYPHFHATSGLRLKRQLLKRHVSKNCIQCPEHLQTEACCSAMQKKHTLVKGQT